jgi:hypothetical protein
MEEACSEDEPRYIELHNFSGFCSKPRRKLVLFLPTVWWWAARVRGMLVLLGMMPTHYHRHDPEEA